MRGPIAYVAGEFPSRSETFVYREVRELRRRGWAVCAVSLNAPSQRDLPGFDDLYDGLFVVYARPGAAAITAALPELLGHPLASAATLVRAGLDALSPGEPTSPPARLKLVYQALAALGLARHLRRRGVRHIHCHFAHAPTTLGMYAARHLGLPFSFTGHANDLFQRRALLARKLRRARFVSCISQWHRAFYAAIAPADASRFQVIRCGVDVDAWRVAPARTHPPDAPFEILTLCRLVEKKGVDTLLRALHLLRQTPGRPWRLTIAGTGPAEDDLRRLARELHCDDAVQWLGAVDNQAVPALLAQSDLFALPCKQDAQGDRDGIPVVLMEAMACGLPVISGDLDAIRELIRDGVNGHLIDGRDPAALADRLRQLACDPTLARRLALAGRARVEEEFALALNVDRLERALAASGASDAPRD